MQLEEPGRYKLEKQASWQNAKHVKLYSDLLHAGLKAGTFDSSGCSIERALICVRL